MLAGGLGGDVRCPGLSGAQLASRVGAVFQGVDLIPCSALELAGRHFLFILIAIFISSIDLKVPTCGLCALQHFNPHTWF